MHLHEFIALKFTEEEGTDDMIKGDQSFHQSHIFIKMAKPLLILLMVADSNQPHMDKLRFIVLVVDGCIRMSIPELNDEYYVLPVPYLEDCEYD